MGTEDYLDADSGGLIYDETERLNYYQDFGRLDAMFADAALAGDITQWASGCLPRRRHGLRSAAWPNETPTASISSFGPLAPCCEGPASPATATAKTSWYPQEGILPTGDNAQLHRHRSTPRRG